MKEELLLVPEMEQVGHADMRDASDTANCFVNYVDSKTGLTLDPNRVQARAEEMKICAEMGVYEHVSEQEFQEDPHQVDRHSGGLRCDEGTPGREERSRLCAQAPRAN